ncbi:MAG: right-handed parallel beta-helix repeat-containing protein [Kiritimatiellae bacterium]|jgi:parallel beta-helix repeat protein|nr:right-handed parallel beta-helix repeat-containing protein [Kiritimatiellia bacterium]
MKIKKALSIGENCVSLAQIVKRVVSWGILFCWGLIVLPCVVQATDIYVSPGGSDENPGTKEKPLATLSKAIEQQRNSGPGTVWLMDGEYSTTSGFVLDKRNNGSESAPLIIRSVVPKKARITGARPVKGFKSISVEDAKTLISEDARKNVLVADLKAQGFPALKALKSLFRAPGVEEVIFGDKPMTVARWPNEGFTMFTELIDAGASGRTHWVQRDVYRPGSFKFPSDRAKYWDISRGVYLHGFWCYEWHDEAIKVASYTNDTRELRFAAKPRYGVGNPGQKDDEQKRQFYALNVFEELDTPGEYYLDRKTNKLYLWPPDDISKNSVYLSLCSNPLLKISQVSNVVLRDLVFENSIDCAVSMENCNNVRVENCLVRNLAQKGINCWGGSNNHIIGCEITCLGSMAINMSAGDRKTLTMGNCSVVGNHLHHLGRHDWGGGRGLNLGGCGNRAAHNYIHDLPTGGICYSGNEHILEFNEIHKVCTIYSDVGVFYTGRDWSSRNNIVRYNLIYDSTGFAGCSHGSQAIYLDDCDSGDTVKGNIVFGGANRGVLLGGGRDNTLEDNIFINLPKGIHIDARGPKGITLDKPGSWNLKTKCERVGYLSPLWKERYPRLARVLDEEPLLPMGNVFRRNILIGCEKPWALSKGVNPEWLTRENNLEFKMEDFPFFEGQFTGKRPDLSKLPEIWKKVPGFEAIPLEKIGLQGM